MSQQEATNRQEPEYVSMLNLQEDTEELLHFNPEADANAALPPIPAGTYPFVARFTEDDPEKRVTVAVWGKDMQKTFVSSITLTLYATEGGAYDNRTVRHQVSTYTMERSGTNSMQGLLQGLGHGEQLKSCRTRAALVLLLNEALGGDGTAGDGVVIDWEATEQLDEEERAAYKAKGKKPWRKQGMRNFPKDSTGQPVPEVDHDGETCRAYNVVLRFVTKSEPGTGNAGTGGAAMEAPQPVAAARPTVRQPQAPSAAPSAPQQVQQGPPVPASARRTTAPVPVGTRK